MWEICIRIVLNNVRCYKESANSTRISIRGGEVKSHKRPVPLWIQMLKRADPSTVRSLRSPDCAVGKMRLIRPINSLESPFTRANPFDMRALRLELVKDSSAKDNVRINMVEGLARRWILITDRSGTSAIYFILSRGFTSDDLGFNPFIWSQGRCTRPGLWPKFFMTLEFIYFNFLKLV